MQLSSFSLVVYCLLYFLSAPQQVHTTPSRFFFSVSNFSKILCENLFWEKKKGGEAKQNDFFILEFTFVTPFCRSCFSLQQFHNSTFFWKQFFASFLSVHDWIKEGERERRKTLQQAIVVSTLPVLPDLVSEVIDFSQYLDSFL
jgi:hypothetical protein